MGKLTKKRQAELMKQYPDADAVGRGAVNFYLDSQKTMYNPSYKPALTGEELLFLREKFSDGDRAIYGRYSKFIEVLSQIGLTAWGWIHCFNHMFYRIQYYALPIAFGLNGAAAKDEEVKNICNLNLKALETTLLPMWELIGRSIRCLLIYDFILFDLGEAGDFDLHILRPNLQQIENDFISLQKSLKVIVEAIHSFPKRATTLRDKVKVSTDVYAMLRLITNSKFDDFKLPADLEKMLREPFKLFSKVIDYKFLAHMQNTLLHDLSVGDSSTFSTWRQVPTWSQES